MSSQSHMYTLMKLRTIKKQKDRQRKREDEERKRKTLTKQKKQNKAQKNRFRCSRHTRSVSMPHTYAGMIFIVTAQSVYLLYSWYVCWTVHVCVHIYKTLLTEFINFNGQFSNSFKYSISNDRSECMHVFNMKAYRLSSMCDTRLRLTYSIEWLKYLASI